MKTQVIIQDQIPRMADYEIKDLLRFIEVSLRGGKSPVNEIKMLKNDLLSRDYFFIRVSQFDNGKIKSSKSIDDIIRYLREGAYFSSNDGTSFGRSTYQITIGEYGKIAIKYIDGDEDSSG